MIYTKLFNEDCIAGMPKKLEPESIDLVVTSIPFGALFIYSGKIEDVGNNQDGIDLRAGQFGLHMRFFVEQLLHVMKPGTIACIHIQQLLRYKIQHGYAGRRDFRGAVVDIFESGGFEYKGEWAIPKNPQIIARRLKLHSLQFKTAATNARKLAPAVNDYMMVFQKPGEAEPVPALIEQKYHKGGWLSKLDWIRDAHGVMIDLHKTFEENFELDGYGEALTWWIDHVDLETGIWPDINEKDVLEGWKNGRDDKEEKHVCPLQLEPIRRIIRLYSNPGDVVMDPYMGIGSTAWVAAEQRRNSIGFEIKESYYRLAKKNAKIMLDRVNETSAAEPALPFQKEETA